MIIYTYIRTTRIFVTGSLKTNQKKLSELSFVVEITP